MRRICLPILVAAALLFARSLFSLARSVAPLEDDGMNVSVARNLADGHGYRSGALHDRAFDAEITTGPAVIVPVALALRLAGPRPTVPSVAVALLSLATCALFLVLIWRSGERGPAAAAAIALLLLGRAAAAGDPWPYGFWYTALGEVPGLMLAACGLCLWCERSGERSRAVGALLLGLSFLCKIAFMPFAAAALVPALRGRDRRAWLVALLVPLPFLVWELVQVAVLGPVAFGHQLVRETLPFFQLGSHFGPHAIGPTMRERLVMLAVLAGRWRALLALALVLPILVGARRRLAAANLSRLALALAAGAALLGAWWLFISPLAWMRQVYPALLALEIAVVLAVVAASQGRAWPVGLALALLLAGRPPRELLSPPQSPTPRLQALLATAAFVAPLARTPGVSLLADGDKTPRDLELMLDAPIVRPAAAPPGRHLLLRNEFSRDGEQDPVRRFAATCRPLFTRDPYDVLDCP